MQQTIIGEAVKNAVEQMSTGIVANNAKLQTRTISVSSLVAAVNGGQVILNVGGKAGLKAGDQLNVERVTREIKDPATGQVFDGCRRPWEWFESPRWMIFPRWPCRFPARASFKVGDAVKTVTQ